MRKQRHNLSSYRLLTMDMGLLYPCGVMEVLPGDEFRHQASTMIRLSPMAAPVMHNITIRTDHMFCPSRIVWPKGDPSIAESFEDFMTGGEDGTETRPMPTMETTGVAKDVMDYMGLPTVAGIPVQSLPIRAYNECYNQWFRDQDLVPPVDLENTELLRVAWPKDYYTTSRPWPQKGPEVTLPLGQSAPVVGAGVPEFQVPGVTAPATLWSQSNELEVHWSSQSGSAGQAQWLDPKLEADLSQATAATVNNLRLASALQRFAEARARWGSRYSEFVRHAFGAKPLDARLQRPEYLGGGTAQVSVSEVLQTAPEVGPDNRYGVGDLYGHGIGMSRSNRYTTKFSEHGYVISFLSVRPQAVYSNGIDRMWLRKDREDFYQQELAHIGQQPVYTQEVYADATNAGEVFGWADRYAEYRGTSSRVTGEFRTELDYWHLARQFTGAPALNKTFVECNPSKRIFNVTDEDVNALWAVVNHKVQARRVVPRNARARLL